MKVIVYYAVRIVNYVALWKAPTYFIQHFILVIRSHTYWYCFTFIESKSGHEA